MRVSRCHACVQVRKKREFVKIRKDELKQDEGAAASAQACGSQQIRIAKSTSYIGDCETIDRFVHADVDPL